MGTLGQSRKFCQFLTRKPEIETNGTVEQPVEVGAFSNFLLLASILRTMSFQGALSMDGVSFTYPNRPTNQVLNVSDLKKFSNIASCFSSRILEYL